MYKISGTGQKVRTFTPVPEIEGRKYGENTCNRKP